MWFITYLSIVVALIIAIRYYLRKARKISIEGANVLITGGEEKNKLKS